MRNPVFQDYQCPSREKTDDFIIKSSIIEKLIENEWRFQYFITS